MASRSRKPIQHYLPVQRQADLQIGGILEEAAKDAEAIIKRLGDKAGVGSKIRRAQLQIMRREVLKNTARLYAAITPTLEASMAEAGVAAAEAESVLNRHLLREVSAEEARIANAGMQAWAEHTVDNLISRTENGISLSRQVYRTRAWSNGLLNRRINSGIALGYDTRELAASVRSLIDPNVRGGVSYASRRLARTEINNAFHRSYERLTETQPWVLGYEWHLSSSHPKPDPCDELVGQHAKGALPAKPHPQCLCYVTSLLPTRDQFISAYLGGQYNSYFRNPLG